MNILYISYWSINEPLTDSTVIPHLKIAGEFESVNNIFLLTIEKEKKDFKMIIPKVTHIPLYSSSTHYETLNKIIDFVLFRKRIIAISKQKNIDLIIAKGVFAGALAYKVSKRNKIPFITESFEPHANYMEESNEWRSTNLKFNFLKKWEYQQIKNATQLFTVSVNYKKYLEETYGNKNISNIPCCVNTLDFKYSSEERNKIRKILNISNEITGIYVGKFGGIYYDKEAFYIFSEAFRFFKNFRLLILTPNDITEVEKKISNAGIDITKVEILFVNHSEVPKYLSASDFAFSTIKPAPSRKYCSPVKNGEYWANGLPILMTKGVGDDSNIIRNENGGAIFDLKKNDLIDSLEKIKTIIGTKNYRTTINTLAIKYRSFSIVKDVYSKLFIK